MTWEDIGFLIGQNWGKAITGRMNNKEQKLLNKDVDAYNQASEADVNANTQKFGDGIVGQTPENFIKTQKELYNTAKTAGDEKGMQAAHERANMGRSIGTNMGIDMSAYGADKTLQNLNAAAGNQQRIYPYEAKSENIGKGLGLLESAMANQQPQQPQQGFLTQTMEQYKGLYPEQQQQQPTLSEMIMKYQPDQQQAQQQRAMTLDDLSKVTGIDYTAQAQAMAEKSAKSRMLDDSYVANVEKMLVEKGYSQEAIDKALVGVKDKGKQAQTEHYTQQFITSQQGGDSMGAVGALTKLAQINPVAAQALGAQVPSFKDVWNVGVGCENAATQQQYRNDIIDKNFDYSQRGADANLDRQKDLYGFTANVKRVYGNLSDRDRVDFLRELGIPEENIQMAALGLSGKKGTAPKVEKLPAYAKVVDKATEKAIESITEKDIKLSGDNINKLIGITNDPNMPQEHKNYIINIGYALNALREYNAGYVDKAREYAKYVDKSTWQEIVQGYGYEGLPEELFQTTSASKRLPRNDDGNGSGGD